MTSQALPRPWHTCPWEDERAQKPFLHVEEGKGWRPQGDFWGCDPAEQMPPVDSGSWWLEGSCYLNLLTAIL